MLNCKQLQSAMRLLRSLLGVPRIILKIFQLKNKLQKSMRLLIKLCCCRQRMRIVQQTNNTGILYKRISIKDPLWTWSLSNRLKIFFLKIMLKIFKSNRIQKRKTLIMVIYVVKLKGRRSFSKVRQKSSINNLTT